MHQPVARPRPRLRTTGTVIAAAAAVLALGAPGVPGAGGVAHAENEDAAGELEFNPPTAAPGTEVTVNTTACGPEGAGSGEASSLGVNEFPMERATHKEVLVGKFKVPNHTTGGEYPVTVSCADGQGSAMGALWVEAGAPVPSPHHPSPTHSPTTPTGHVRTGVGGGTTGPGTPQIAVGAAVLAASAVGGGWLLLRRRARETQQHG
ncbi:hypothetical protein [Streptomyces sp. NPDC058657]|uniref:hypothetical protein n=1 Tax=unclassified Streptomyces TaxID=2593676 RepID=UPI0036628244